MELIELYKKLLEEGCTQFYIEGVGGPTNSDVECLGRNNGKWEVYYTERGQKTDIIFSSADKDEACEYYYNHIMQIEHWHLVVFTRSKEILQSYRKDIQNLGIHVIQNDIPDYEETNDRVYRLFVVNKDIFKVKEQIKSVPYFDRNLQ